MSTEKKERRPVGVARARKGRNLSRKQVLEAHRKAWLAKQKKLQDAKDAEKREKTEKIAKATNKRQHKSFDRMVLSAVQEGLVSVVTENLKEAVTPLSIFFAANTAVAKSTEASQGQLPYLLSIMSSCVPHLSQGFLFHEHKAVFALCETVVAENANRNHLATVKALKLAQRILLSFQVPSLEVLESYERALKPKNYVNVEATDVFLTTYRRLLENAALCTEFRDPSAPFIDTKRKVSPATVAGEKEASMCSQENGIYRLNAMQVFFTTALPRFVDLCVAMLSEYPPRAVVSIVFDQLRFLFHRCFSPYICESREGRQLIDRLLSQQLLSLLKPVFKDYWASAVELFEVLFEQLSYIKRVPGSTPFHCPADDEAAKTAEGASTAAAAATRAPFLFTERFPAVVFLLKVLNKLRVMDDARLNRRVERAMVAIAKGMTIREFTEIIPFDPCAAYEMELAEEKGTADVDEDNEDDEDEQEGGRARASRRRTSQELWATSYTLNVIKKAASHDSLPFFVEHFFPFIRYASLQAKTSEKSGQTEVCRRWSALLLQLWRVALGFCQFPLEIDNDSFRDLAKQLVGLLHVKSAGSVVHEAFFVDTAATAIHVLCDGYHRLAKLEEDVDDVDASEADKDGAHGPHGGFDGGDADDLPSSDDEDDDDEEEDRVRGGGPGASGGFHMGLDSDEEGSETAAGSKGRASLFGRVRRRNRRSKGDVVANKDALLDDTLYLSYHDPDWSPHRYHNISRAKAAIVCSTIFSKYSANIMPRLCNVFEQHDSTAVLAAIQSFANVCAPAVMANILESILTVGSSIAALTEEARAEGEALGRTRAGSAPLASKRRVVLDIACAVVPQLPAAHVQSLFCDVIEPVLMDPAPESRLLQKKAYKLLYALFEHRVKDIFSYFPRIFGLLAVGRRHVTASGIKMRVKCLSWALDACKMFYEDQLLPTIKATVGEVILFSREKSSVVRQLTMDTLEKMQHYGTQSAGAPTNFLLHLVVAGLSGKTAVMVSSSLVCMAKILYVTHETLGEKDLNAAVALGFQLMASAMQEVRSAATIFARMVLKLSKRSPPVFTACERALDKLLYAIALVTTQPHVSSNTRVQMRVLLEKCIQRFTMEKIDPIFPTGSKNFLRYTHKMLRREERKDERAARRQEAQVQNEFNEFFMNGGDTLAMRAGGADAEDAGDDLLEAGAITSFVARHTQTSNIMYPGVGGVGRGGGARADGLGEPDEYDTMHLEFADGKMRIMSVEEKAKEVELKRRQALAERLLQRNRGALLNADAVNEGALGGTGRVGAKRRRDGEEEDFENDELILRYGGNTSDAAVSKAASAYTKGRGEPGAGAANVVGPSANQIARLRDQKAAKQELKRRRVEEDIKKGEEFRGTGSGDVRRGNIEPYAYVPLNRRYMNRRHSRQALHRFQVIHTTQLKGEKAKAVQERK